MVRSYRYPKSNDEWWVLNGHKHRISTGLQEAINGKIGTLQHNARGYRDDEYLKLRIFDLHNKTYALTG